MTQCVDQYAVHNEDGGCQLAREGKRERREMHDARYKIRTRLKFEPVLFTPHSTKTYDWLPGCRGEFAELGWVNNSQS